MRTAYTEVPYHVVKHTNGWTIQTREGGVGSCIAQQYEDSSIENANFIVTACNSHSRLVMSLQRLLERFEMDRREGGPTPHEINIARDTLASLGL
jgi:hypothetical protein